MERERAEKVRMEWGRTDRPRGRGLRERERGQGPRGGAERGEPSRTEGGPVQALTELPDQIGLSVSHGQVAELLPWSSWGHF